MAEPNKQPAEVRERLEAQKALNDILSDKDSDYGFLAAGGAVTVVCILGCSTEIGHFIVELLMGKLRSNNIRRVRTEEAANAGQGYVFYGNDWGDGLEFHIPTDLLKRIQPSQERNP